jgi:hypothetical protein
MGSSHYLAHVDIPEAMNGDDIPEEMEKYESLLH